MFHQKYTYHTCTYRLCNEIEVRKGTTLLLYFGVKQLKEEGLTSPPISRKWPPILPLRKNKFSTFFCFFNGTAKTTLQRGSTDRQSVLAADFGTYFFLNWVLVPSLYEIFFRREIVRKGKGISHGLKPFTQPRFF